jgi:hypothetical protein
MELCAVCKKPIYFDMHMTRKDYTYKNTKGKLKYYCGWSCMCKARKGR